MKKALTLILAIMLGMIVSAAVGFAQNSSNYGGVGKLNMTFEQAIVKKDEIDAYRKKQNSTLSYEDVVKILGGIEGEVLGKNLKSNIKSYRWYCSDEGEIMFYFTKDGKCCGSGSASYIQKKK